MCCCCLFVCLFFYLFVCLFLILLSCFVLFFAKMCKKDEKTMSRDHHDRFRRETERLKVAKKLQTPLVWLDKGQFLLFSVHTFLTSNYSWHQTYCSSWKETTITSYNQRRMLNLGRYVYNWSDNWHKNKLQLWPFYFWYCFIKHLPSI